MGRRISFAIAVLVALTSPLAARGAQEPVRVYTVPSPAAERRPAPLALLADRLGPLTASSSVGAPVDDPSTAAAERLPRKGAAFRQYGPVRVTVFEMADESTAFAILRYVRPADAETRGLGDDSWSSAGATAVRVGHFAFLIEGGEPAVRHETAGVLVARIGRPAPSAPLLDELPQSGKVAGSERYAPSYESLRRLRPDLEADVFRLAAGGADAAVADYEQPGQAPFRLVLVDYQTPQLAADAERGLTSYFATLAPEVQRERMLKREGNYMLEAVGIADREAAARLLDGVKYSFAIKMLKGRNPLPMLNFDEETYKAALVFVNSFTIVGLCFLGAIASGLVVGAFVFRRRRRAAEGLFTDAGGMTHLDLMELNGSRQLSSGGGAGLLPSGPGD